LVTNKLLVQSNDDHEKYDFQHKLTQEVLYSNLPFTRRRDWHTQLAKYYLAENKLRQTVQKDWIIAADKAVQHFEAVSEWRLAVQNLFLMAKPLVELKAYSDLDVVCQRARANLEKIPGDFATEPELISIKSGLLALQGDVALMQDDYLHALSHYENALKHSDSTPSFDRARMTRKLALTYPLVGKGDQCQKLLEELLDDDPTLVENLPIAITLT
jgi:predicted ATPase